MKNKAFYLNRLAPFLPFLPLLLVALLYFNVREFNYVWDDVSLFLDSPALRDPHNLWDAISRSILPGTTYFRPLVLLSFVAEFKIFGVNPSVSHLINLAILLINSVLVGILALRLSPNVNESCKFQRMALAIAIYGLHPVLIESSVWVAGRFDLLVTSFCLSSLVFFSYLKGVARLISVSASFFLAALCKEMAVVLPVILFVWLWVMEENGVRRLRLDFWSLFEKKNLTVFLGLIIAGCIYLFLRYCVHTEVFVANKEVEGSLNFAERLSFFGYTVLFYIKMLLWPFSDINPMHPFNIKELSGFKLLLGMFFASLYLFSAVLILTKWRSKAVLLFAVCAISFLPVLNILPLNIGGNIGHERFMALPVAFFSLALVEMFFNISGKFKNKLIVFLVLWFSMCILNIKVTVPLWRNEFSLWYWAYEKNPSAEYIRFNYVASAIFMGQLDIAEKAIDEIEKEGRGLSDRLKAVKGQLLVRQGYYDKALPFLRDALSKEYQVHEEIIRNGADVNNFVIVRDNVPNAWYLRYIYGSLVEAHLYMGDYDKASSYLRVMEFYGPDYPVVKLMRSLIFYGRGEILEGDKYFGIALGSYADLAQEKVYEVRHKFINNLCEVFPDKEVCKYKLKYSKY